MGKQNVDFADQWKNFCERLYLCCLQCNICFVCAIYNHFCEFEYPLLQPQLACRWMCDSPRNGCAWRLTPTHMWREQAKTKAYIYVMHISFVRTNYCIRKWWPMVPLQQILPPWLKPLVTPLMGALHVALEHRHLRR